MIKRIIQNKYGNRLEVVGNSDCICVIVDADGFFQFDNDEDIHCFISELQGAMLRAKEKPKEDRSVDPEPQFLCRCGKPKFTDRCTILGCDNWNVFGLGTVDTTSNGTYNDK